MLTPADTHLPHIHRSKEQHPRTAVDRSEWDRNGAICGLLYVLMSLLGWGLWRVATGGAPPTSDPASRLAGFYVEHQGLTQIALAFWSLALAPLVVFLVVLYHQLRRAEGGDGTGATIFFAGSLIGGVALTGVSFTAFWTAAYRPGDTLPQITQFAQDLVMLTGPPVGALLAAAFFAVWYVVARHGGLPRWLGRGATLVALAQLLYLPAGAATRGVFDPANGLLGAYVAYGSHFVWIALVSWVALRKKATPASAPARG